MATELITNSRMQTFRLCARLHDVKYNQGYRTLAASDALEFGTVIHAGLEAWWRFHMDGGPRIGSVATETTALDAALVAIDRACSAAQTCDEAARAKANVLMAGYSARWTDAVAEYEVLAVEQAFDAPMRKPSGRKARGVRLSGKLDALARRRSDGTVWVVEHKSSSADLSPGSTYWQRLRLDSQISVYFDGAASLGHGEVAGCLYDVIKKPDLRPYKATPVDARKFTKDGRLYATQREADETADEFRARLVETIAAAPDQYFQRQEVVRLDAELAASRRDTWETAEMIRLTALKGYAPRNVASCHAYGRECSFIGVCEGRGSLDDETKFVRNDNVHPELG